MFCKQCGNDMEDTQGTSFGTGEKMLRCKQCGWTGTESTCLSRLLSHPDDVLNHGINVLHHGIKYSDYKAVLNIVGADGEPKMKFITFRADIITAIMEAGLVIQAFKPGDTISIEAAPHKLMMSTATFVVNQA
jgi:hypothetical protein